MRNAATKDAISNLVTIKYLQLDRPFERGHFPEQRLVVNVLAHDHVFVQWVERRLAQTQQQVALRGQLVDARLRENQSAAPAAAAAATRSGCRR